MSEILMDVLSTIGAAGLLALLAVGVACAVAWLDRRGRR